jgi:hypothetical protein
MKSPYHELEAEEAAAYIAEGALAIDEQTWTAEEIEGHKRHFSDIKDKADAAKKRKTQADAASSSEAAVNEEAIAQRVAALIAAPKQLPLRRVAALTSDAAAVAEGAVRRASAPGTITFRESEYESVVDSIGRAARSARHAERLCEQAAQSFKAEATALEAVREHLQVQMYQAQL